MADHKELARQCNHLAGVIDMGEAVQFSMQRATTLLRACAAALEAEPPAAPNELAAAYEAAAEVDRAGGDAPHAPSIGLAAWIRARHKLDTQPAPAAGSVQQRAKEWADEFFYATDNPSGFLLSLASCVELAKLLDECAQLAERVLRGAVEAGEQWLAQQPKEAT